MRRLRYAAPQLKRGIDSALARAKRRLPHARVEGVDWYWPEDEQPGASRETIDDQVRLLAPFDPIVWDRRRFELLWAWPYRFEAYNPAPKRRFGYYALPLLWREHVIGWANVSLKDGALAGEFGYVDSAGAPARPRLPPRARGGNGAHASVPANLIVDRPARIGQAVECAAGPRPRTLSKAPRSALAWNAHAACAKSPSMSLAVVLSRGLAGLDAPLVTVEVHLAGGLPAFNLVGLPDTEVRESRDRVRAALQNAQFEFPARKITVNLAPADLPKESGRFDLPIAIGVLAATKQIPDNALASYEFAGELALGGALRPIRGALPMALCARRDRRAFVLPAASAAEAALARDAVVYPAESLLAVCGHLAGRELLVTAGRAHGRARRRRSPSPISPTCAVNRRRSARSRSPPRARTAC